MLSRVPLALGAVILSGAGALAADLPAKAAPAPAVPESCKATISLPAFGGTIKQNPNPICLTVGGFGDIYVGGALSGYAYTQTNQFPFSPR